MFSKFMDVLNDLQPKQLLMLAGGTAVVIFIAVYFALTGMARNNNEIAAKVNPVNQPATIQVVMAREDIPSHTVIQDDMLELRDVPVDAIPKGAMMNTSEVVGQPAASNIYAGDVITLSKLMVDKQKTGFVGEIPENCRAVSVGISEITGVAGFAKPGDYVDVILVEKGTNGATSHFLLKNVLLLGINQNASQDKDSGKTDKDNNAKKSKPAIATLALEPDDMLQLISAAAVGEIYLALRPFHAQDTGNFLNAYTTNRSERSSATAASPAPARSESPRVVYQAAPAAPAAAPSAPAVTTAPSSGGYEVIQGDKVVAN
ncbi:putative Flp pilus assembly protein CpaB [Selenomonas ruminantium subsp. lactilytica TAM6421]|uniref:Putative Flp pilus assembly protein CpaB n=1 Tax=Selenomonas ruminantium subsp. lactilytica (strain NBRC 103574 / TAM6421) TaxID=927704 RepID=I0GLU2_SELRL|nr:Flp pilus assembly protein CpaB [Selenomonas ruminantium]BAL81729.1 putative Flp pilus assembly protein CpaB [Selenomonas ruminantium subsp. lactilytica TAM6421]